MSFTPIIRYLFSKIGKQACTHTLDPLLQTYSGYKFEVLKAIRISLLWQSIENLE